ncbi:MAG: DUF1735 domain-containing protein [Bacteroidales bacterium]|jgi:hypothetical protein|nr:DUF1735 domain-containing protein [Bacteroidales bacterium]
MKKIILIAIIITGLIACENQENLFPDHEYLNPDGTGTGKFYGVYFGEQYPVRTLVLGHERFENPDNDSLFHIGVSIGGMYTNKRDWRVDYILDKKLADSVIIGTTGTANDTAMVLPDAYYSIGPSGSVTIPKGSFNGLIEVKLKKEFFADPKAFTKKYVVPLRITDTDADTILSGRVKAGYDYDIRRAGDFDVTPKNFTLFIIKFINPYHGIYFHRGAATYDGAAAPTIYRSQYLEWNATRSLITNSQFGVTLDGIANNKGGAFKMNLSFNGEDITISPATGATYAVTGTGKFFNEKHANAETIAGQKYPTMYLDYTYTVGTTVYTAKDTLVRRERGIKFEFVDASAVKPFNKIPIK